MVASSPHDVLKKGAGNECQIGAINEKNNIKSIGMFASQARAFDRCSFGLTGHSSTSMSFFILGAGFAILLWFVYTSMHHPSDDCNKSEIRYFKDCMDAYLKGEIVSGVYAVNPDHKMAFLVYCDMTTDGGGWTVFQRRTNGSVDFFRSWKEYEEGFGNFRGEHWLGLDKIHRLTSSVFQELRVELGDFRENWRFANYHSFSIAGPSEKYRLQVEGYSGDAGDSMISHSGMQFTTKDQDNDIHNNSNCASGHRGAWWYTKCHRSNLNGRYYNDATPKKFADGIHWFDWTNYTYSLKFTEMKTRSHKLI